MNPLVDDPKDYPELLAIEKALLGAKLDVWDNIVRRRFPDFSCREMIEERNLPFEVIYISTLTSVSEVKIIDQSGGMISKSGYYVEFGFRSETMRDAKNLPKEVFISAVRFSPELMQEFEACGLKQGLI